jgi:hypothetical protein
MNTKAENEQFRTEVCAILRDRYAFVMLAGLATASYITLKIEYNDMFTLELSIFYIALLPALWLAVYLMDRLYARFHYDENTINRRAVAIADNTVAAKCKNYKACRESIWKGAALKAMREINEA